MRGLFFNIVMGFILFCGVLCFAETRDIEVVNDNDADTIVSKIYKLKYTKAANILPYVTDAVKSAIGESDAIVTDVTAFRYGMDEEDAIVVTMKESMVKDIDAMIKLIDRPGIDGSGFFNFEYTLKYRHNMDFYVNIINIASNDSRFASIAGEKILFKSNKGWGIIGMKWLKRLDKLVPRSEITFNVYEVSEDNIQDLGVDYTSWLADVHAGTIKPFQQAWTFTNTRTTSPDWDTTHSNDFVFNGSYIRMLQQKGIAHLSSTGSIMVKNNMELLPSGYDSEIILVSTDANGTTSEINIKLSPLLFYNSEFSELTWSITATNNDNVHSMTSEAKLVNNQEKILFSYNRQHNVTQYNGMPFLGDIPYIKYLFGDELKSKVNSRVFVTVTVTPINGTNLNSTANDIIAKSEMTDKSNEEDK